MLTKDHLKFRVRAGRAYPTFVNEKDPALLQVAEDLVGLFRQAEGMRVGELEETALALQGDALGLALTKLLLDGCDAEDDDGKAMAFRWQCFKEAESLRRAKPGVAREDFQQELAGQVGVSYADLAETLYGDLPARRRVSAVKETSPEVLLRRYNCAQVQGLLLQARSVEIRVKDTRLSERRELFRQLRFHRLMADVVDPGLKDQMIFRIGGPLSIFEQQATYGMRLANFFPHLLHLEQWEVEAEVKAKAKYLNLKLDQKSGLRSHYKQRTPYVPEEMTAFMALFNDRNKQSAKKWSAELGDEFVHIGRESYCFPDITITGHDGQKIHVELFHRWHASQLLGRLQALEKNPVSHLLMGVSKTLMKDKVVDEALKNSSYFGKWGFSFSEFPTPKVLMTTLERIC